MSTITTINSSDNISSSRTVINTNFSNLNTDKIETSVIDTDTALAANSDAKLPSQKAVKAYADALLAIFTSSRSGTSAGPASSSTQTITHNLGRTPVVIRVHGIGEFTSDANGTAYSTAHGTYNATGNRCVYQTGTTTTRNPNASSTFAVYLDADNATSTASGVIQNVTSTSFDIVWTASANVSTSTYFIWEAN